jgi:maltooligosyltrehalose trehalohydrolase
MTSAERLASHSVVRRMPIGAEIVPDGGVHFRVWAPKLGSLSLHLEEGLGAGAPLPMLREEGGYFSVFAAAAGEGTRYRYEGPDGPFPDPASRAQPLGPHGPSEVVDPERFAWTDHAWRGAKLEGQVVYEMHVGTFTREGTWKSATRELDRLAELGVTLLEVMPIAEFAGDFGWGYDGVNLFAPYHVYGVPDDVRAFVDRAHGLGLGVLLDVVYNHFGPDGNYLTRASGDYFSDRHHTDWGAAIAFDGPASRGVRELFATNAGYWIDEFHFDGLRLDATQSIFDDSAKHILVEIGERVREAAAGRETVVVAENEPQLAKLARPVAHGGYGLDALWNDDFHHAALVALTGRAEAYYSGYDGSPQELISATKSGFLYQGQRYAWQDRRRGSPSRDLRPCQFVVFLENHDQSANSALGTRLHRRASPSRHRALVALLLLGPGTPMLFQGEEFGSPAPFLYFAHHGSGLAEQVRSGRRDFLAQFPSIGAGSMRERLAAPDDPQTFARCKLDSSAGDAGLSAMYRDLIALRKADGVFSTQEPGGIDGAVIGPAGFVLRMFGSDGDDRLLLVNLGRELDVRGGYPLFAPPDGRRWQAIWSSEDPRYGGSGSPDPEHDGGWDVPGEIAIALRAVKGGAP